MAARRDPTNATRAGGVRPRPDEKQARLVGDLPAEAAFAAEYPGGDLLAVQLARALEHLAGSVSAAVAQVWREHGLSHAAGNALAVIEGADRPLTPGEISAAMHITSGSMTSLIDTLVKKGLVRRTEHADDRRKVLVEITSAGRTCLDEALPSVVLRARDLQTGLTKTERRQLFELLGRWYDSLGDVDLTTVPVGTRHRPARLTRDR